MLRFCSLSLVSILMVSGGSGGGGGDGVTFPVVLSLLLLMLDAPVTGGFAVAKGCDLNTCGVSAHV